MDPKSVEGEVEGEERAVIPSCVILAARNYSDGLPSLENRFNPLNWNTKNCSSLIYNFEFLNHPKWQPNLILASTPETKK